MFYAVFCPFGKIANSSFRGSAYTFYAFKTKAARDEYVNINEYTAFAISAKQMGYLAGRNFRLDKSSLEYGAYTVEFNRHRLKNISAKCAIRF